MEELRQEDKIAGQVPRFWKEDKTARLLLKVQLHPKVGLVWSCLSLAVLDCLVTPLMCSRAFALSLFLNQLSSWIRMAAEDGHEGSPSRWKAMQGVENMEMCTFSPFLCLPVKLKFNGLPSRQSLPSFPPEKRWATAHSCGLYPGYHVADTANHRPVLSDFKI